ncbi:hypothetical protein IIC65_08835, partial [Candidatus Sumerlaeota bacterium]|nr:hypothetical protein [Candidatus Sumerlaeota bacterium]
MEETKDQTEDRTRFWMKELEGVTRERLGREARAAVTLNNLKGAARCGEALILRGASAQDSAKLSAFLAEALAGLARDRDRSGRVIQIIARSGAIKERGVALDENFAKAVARPATGFEESNREWTQVLNAAAASLEEYCPRKNQTGEPSQADLSTFIGEITAVLRAGIAKNPKVDFR